MSGEDIWACIGIASALAASYGLGRFIRYQRWSPVLREQWTITYQKDGLAWDYQARRAGEWEFGVALTYAAAVRRSRRSAYLADRRVTIAHGGER